MHKQDSTNLFQLSLLTAIIWAEEGIKFLPEDSRWCLSPTSVDTQNDHIR